METVWFFILIITGTTSSQSVEESGFLGGNVVNRSQMYFMTEEQCNAGRQLMVDLEDAIVDGLGNAEVKMTECQSTEFEITKE